MEEQNLNGLTDEKLLDLYYMLKEIEKYEKYNKLEYFEPYEFQKKFMNAGKKYKQRLLRCGNRVG